MKTMPVRIQRKRTKGWRMPPNAVYVGRPTAFGNPFVPGRYFMRGDPCLEMDAGLRMLWSEGLSRDARHDPRMKKLTADEAVEWYRWWVTEHAKGIRDRLPELWGKDLACWCPLVDAHGNYCPCHADVLLSMANDLSIEEVIRENHRRAERQAL